MKSSRLLLAALALAVAVKAALLAAQAVPFNSDEAVVGLMARHINDGALPLFFYGQAYMGSLDAFLVAGVFRVFSEAVWGIRLVQIALYAVYLGTLWLLARRFFGEQAASFTVLVAAIPPVVVSTYTTATLGGYGETLLFGNLILFLGYEVTLGAWQEKLLAWLALGLIGGLAFWTLGMAGVYLLPIGILGLRHFRLNRLGCYSLAALAFIAGSLPWWMVNFTSNGEALGVLLGTSRLEVIPTTPWDRLIGLVFLGVPALIGIRAPWEAHYIPPGEVFLGVILFLGVIFFLFEGRRKGYFQVAEGAGGLLALFVGGFLVVFIGSHFGLDATGRYLLPLYAPLAMGTGLLASWLWRKRAVYGAVFIGLVLLFNSAETWRAAASPAGLTTQFDPITRFDNAHDAELIDFLHEQGETRGYANYWVTFRLAFLSREEILFSPRLPYKADLSYTENDNRYPAYEAAAAQSPRAAYITTLHPTLDEQLRSGFARLGIRFREQQIGPYHVFYALSGPVRPEELNLIVPRPAP